MHHSLLDRCEIIDVTEAVDICGPVTGVMRHSSHFSEDRLEAFEWAEALESSGPVTGTMRHPRGLRPPGTHGAAAPARGPTGPRLASSRSASSWRLLGAGLMPRQARGAASTLR